MPKSPAEATLDVRPRRAGPRRLHCRPLRCQMLRRQAPERPIEELLQLGPRLHGMEVLVRARITRASIDIARGRFHAEGVWENSWEDEQHSPGMTTGEGPACWNQIGYVSGFATGLFGRLVVARETQCLSHLLTPETETSTHYFFASVRNFMVDDAAFNDAKLANMIHTFKTEDEPLIAAVQAEMGSADFWSLKPALLSCDPAPVKARRRLQKLIEDEAAAAATAIPLAALA